MDEYRGSPGALILAGGAVVLLVAVPLGELFATAADGGIGPAGRAVASAEGLRAVINTLGVAAAVTALAVLFGAAAALTTERTRAPARRALRLAVLLPLIIPGFVAALSWARAYGPSGLIDDLGGPALPGLFGALGVVAVLTAESVPLAYLVVAAALASRSEGDFERAARASGATPAQALRTVTLPLLRPALTAAASLVFITSVNAFGVPAVLGLPGGFATLTTRIYADLALSADPSSFTRAVALSAGLVLVSGAAVAFVDAAGARRIALRVGSPAGDTVLDRVRWPGVALWACLTFAVGVPLLALVLTAVTRAAGLPPVPENWTLANFATALAPSAGGALARSVVLAGLAATVVVVLGGLLVALRGSRGGRALGTAATLTFAVPGTSLAVAMLLAYGPWLRDTLALILLAYVAKFWALGHRPLAGAADAVPPDLSRAARASGATAATALRTVVVPLVRPALAAGWLVVFLFGIHELTMSSLLYGPGSQTLAVVILNLNQLGDVTVTSALAVALTMIVLVLSLLLLLVRSRVRVPR